MAKKKSAQQVNPELSSKEKLIDAVRTRMVNIIDMATLEARTDSEKIHIVDSIMNVVVNSLVKADAFDAMGKRLETLFEYMVDKEESHYQVRDHATAYRYMIEKNAVENVQLIYKDLKRGVDGTSK